LLAGALGAAVLPGALRAQAVANVVATTGMIADAAQVLGGGAVAVQGLMGPGVDPHAYRQTRTDIVALTRADLILYHGLFLEAQLEDLMLDLARSRAVVAVAEDIPADLLISHDDYAGRFDPHVWMDPTLWQRVVARVASALAEALPDVADEVGAAQEAYRAELDALQAYSVEVLGTVPEAARVLFTAHDAFNYFGRAYGWEVQGIQGISTESEAGVQRIAELVDMLVARQIGAVFVESSVSDRAMRALIEGAAAQGHEVRIGGELFSDAMGQPGTYEGTYLGMIDHNVTAIAAALGGTVPEGGRLGRLGVAG
jgi:manganese/zinc/iron transport system substrate-binding protein